MLRHNGKIKNDKNFFATNESSEPTFLFGHSKYSRTYNNLEFPNSTEIANNYRPTFPKFRDCIGKCGLIPISKDECNRLNIIRLLSKVHTYRNRKMKFYAAFISRFFLRPNTGKSVFNLFFAYD